MALWCKAMSYREHPKDNYNKQKAILRGANETLDAIKESETGTHGLVSQKYS